MQILARIIQFIFWVVIVGWLVRGLLGWLFGRSKGSPNQARPGRGPRTVTRELHRDAVCGTHVSGDISHRLDYEGGTLHFCSPECRERFRASHRQRASA